MKAIYKQAAMSAVVFSMFAIATPAGAAPVVASDDGGPNDAYCIKDGGGSPWCGYATYEQCQETASGIGGDCFPNAFGEPERRAPGHSSAIR
jgi:Protein of unknown function (DUF3551)